MSDVGELIVELTRTVEDFPQPGVQFCDLSPLLADRHGLAAVTDALAEIGAGADLIAGIDARGRVPARRSRRRRQRASASATIRCRHR